MRIHIAGLESCPQLADEAKPPYILFSYAACGSQKKVEKIIRMINSDYCKSNLLDSGAFTWRKKEKVLSGSDWERYVDSYIDFICQHNIKLFFEMDVDTVLGMGKVEEFRDRIERKTGRQTIPVWHTNRGWDYFVRMCKDYKYISLGGIAGNPNGKALEKVFPHFIETAHKYGTQIHGLGYTNLKNIGKYDFDSVDSTTWNSGSRFGARFFVEGNAMVQRKETPEGKRVDGKVADLHNLKMWVTYAKLMDK